MMGQTARYARPALWGFFISIILAGVFVLVRQFVPSYMNSRWDAERIVWQKQTEKVIRDAFQNRIVQLTQIAEQAALDTVLASCVDRNDIPAALKAFQTLDSYQLQNYQTLDLIDLQGNVLAWNGPSITPQYFHVIGQNPPERFVRLTQNGLRSYLTVGVGLAGSKIYLLASELLELNSPISNRFVQKVSFSGDLSQKLKIQVALHLPQTYTLHRGEVAVPIVDKESRTIAEFSVTEKKLESDIMSVVEVFTMLIALCLAFGSVFLACIAALWIAGKQQRWMTTAAFVLSLWFVRLVWRELEFPADFVGGWIFNPNLYASPFAFGLTSSLGELIISIVVITISSWLFFAGIYFSKRTEEIISRIGRRIGRIGAFAFAAVMILLILWLFRAFGEALRSFVFDSTIQFNNPSEILPEGTAALMDLNILLLGVALLCTSIAILWVCRKLLSVQFVISGFKTIISLIVISLISIILFAFLDETPRIQLLDSVFFMAIGTIGAEMLVRWKKTDLNEASQKWRVIVCAIIGAFLIGQPMMHQRLQQKERRQVETAANEFLRPSDSWLSYVVLDGLHTSAEDFVKELSSNSLTAAKEMNLAFVLWTKTLLGKEGYNSALVLYDTQGNEADRFVVGMSKPEQQEILTRAFEGEEDAVHVLGRTYPKMMQFYGAWLTVRDTSGQMAGSIAILLSENRKTVFHEEDTEPLRQYRDPLEHDMAREIAVHEYRSDTLIFSTGKKLYPDRFLAPEIENELQKTSTSVLWINIMINGCETQTVFVKDASSPERIVSISLEELDFRWDLFSYLKDFFIYLAVMAAAGLCALIWRSSKGTLPAIGFRGKLFLGFACITLLPLAVLSYYNRQLVAERVQEQVETTLYRELNQLEDRIGTYIVDEEDFNHGIDDDFCEALAAENGIDFSIYHRASIQASSRSELYRTALLDGRLNGEAFASAILSGRNYMLSKEKIGSVEYVVGYAPLSIAGSVAGVLEIPTLNRQKEFESELAERNAYVFGAYAIVFGIALAAGGLLALRFARPLHQLTSAAKKVSEGNLDVKVETHSQDEIGELASSFNEMVSKLRTSRSELAKHERENAWKEMAKQVAHEIRNPLTPIKLSIQHLRQAFKDKAPDSEEILQRVTQTVIDQIEALSRIASEFSSFAKMPESKFERLAIDTLLQETINLFREIQGVSFIERLASGSVMIVGDRDQLRGVFINIIRNAIQAINGTGTITVATLLDGQVCIVRITDTGPGIPDEIRMKIFEPNFSTKTTGMGLGLAIARRVVEDHGGTISCSSEHGEGMTFEIRLPF